MDKLRDKSIKYGRINGTTDGSLSDTPYTAYWNKYHPKNASGEFFFFLLKKVFQFQNVFSGISDLVSDPESLDSVPMHHGPKLPSWITPPSPRLNRSNSVRSTKSEKVYSTIMQQQQQQQRNEDGELLNNFTGHHLDNGGDSSRYAASTTGVSRSSLGNYSALLSLSRMGSKEEDCKFLAVPLFDTSN